MDGEKWENLEKLYQKNSKHSNYQILSDSLQRIINQDNLTISSRFEEERKKFIFSSLNIKEKIILDIGGNTGYFSFEALEKGAKHVIYYEGNQDHANFVKLGAKLLNLSDRITIKNEYYSFKNPNKEKCDIVLLLNVLHHVGDDYGDMQLTIDKVKETIQKSLNYLSQVAEYMVFQLGFNWKGNRNICLFENGTKQEMIDFVSDVTSDYWKIISIGIAEKRREGMAYFPISDKNVKRDDSLGEFLNRPIFIMKKKHLVLEGEERNGTFRR